MYIQSSQNQHIHLSQRLSLFIDYDLPSEKEKDHRNM